MGKKICNNNTWYMLIKILLLLGNICITVLKIRLSSSIVFDLLVVIYKEKHMQWNIRLWNYPSKACYTQDSFTSEISKFPAISQHFRSSPRTISHPKPHGFQRKIPNYLPHSQMTCESCSCNYDWSLPSHGKPVWCSIVHSAMWSPHIPHIHDYW